MQLRNPVLGWLALFIILPGFSQLFAQTADLEDPIDTTGALVSKGGSSTRVLTMADLRDRLAYLNGCVEYRTSGVITGYINTYVRLKPEKAKNMLGKRLTYFPIFEQKLREYGLPDDLKYLAVVESALNPKAVSRVGATGLWQFMPSTGSDYGLRANSAMDERSDPVKSTEAAVHYLKDLYHQFNDWALALAAYNSGPGRVNAAIRRSGSRNFWNLQAFLPKETRNYVPAFIAATYICNYYQDHEIEPNIPDFDEQLTGYVTVLDGLSFQDIADATGVDYEVIRNLNPGYKRDYVPPSAEGSYVVVPQRVLPAFVRYLNSLGNYNYTFENNQSFVNTNMGDGRYWKSKVKVQTTERLEVFGPKLGFSGDQLKTWNNLLNNWVYAGDEIEILHPVYVHKHAPGKIAAPVQVQEKPKTPVRKPGDAPALAPAAPAPKQEPVVSAPAEEVKPSGPQFEFHTVRRNESLDDIARQYGTTVDAIRKLNGTDSVKIGTRLKVREQ
jgi:membrane-bound lytic murein transglycosylase D